MLTQGKGHVRTGPSASQGERPWEKPHLGGLPASRTVKKLNSVVGAVCGTLLRQPKQTKAPAPDPVCRSASEQTALSRQAAGMQK